MRRLVRRLRSAIRARIERALLVVFERFLGRPRPGLIDVFFAYRLLLARRPDPQGWEHYRGEIRRVRYPVYWLADCFVQSDGFARRRAEGRGYDSIPVREATVEVEGLKLVVDLNPEGKIRPAVAVQVPRRDRHGSVADGCGPACTGPSPAPTRSLLCAAASSAGVSRTSGSDAQPPARRRDEFISQSCRAPWAERGSGDRRRGIGRHLRALR